MKLLQAYENYRRACVIQLVPPKDHGRLPPLGATEAESSNNLMLYEAALFKYVYQKVDPVPRTIHYSQVYQDRRDLQVQFAPKLTLLEQHLRSGNAAEINDPRNLFLSQRVETIIGFESVKGQSTPRPVARADRLLLERGIRHFHIESPARGPYLLYAILDDANAYFIDIQDHDGLYNPDLLGIVEDEWPDLLGVELVGVTPSDLTAEEIKNLRRKNVNFLSGTARSPHHLVNSAGQPVDLVKRVDQISAFLAQLEANLQANEHEVTVTFTPGTNEQETLMNCHELATGDQVTCALSSVPNSVLAWKI
jgi:hypothetical protein